LEGDKGFCFGWFFIFYLKKKDNKIFNRKVRPPNIRSNKFYFRINLFRENKNHFN